MIRRFFTRLLLVSLIVFCGYNWLEIRTLRTEITDLRVRQSVTARKLVDTDRKLSAPAGWTDSARQLAQNIAALKLAVQSPDTRRKLAALQTQAQALEQQAGILWRKAGAAGHTVP